MTRIDPLLTVVAVVVAVVALAWSLAPDAPTGLKLGSEHQEAIRQRLLEHAR